MAKDLGTYHARVELDDGRGWIQEFNTGCRYTNGKGGWFPLDATPIGPTYDDEADVLNGIEYLFMEGNYACDCNKALFLEYAQQKDGADNHPCGDTLKIRRLTAIRPDRSEVVLFDSSSVRTGADL